MMLYGKDPVWDSIEKLALPGQRGALLAGYAMSRAMYKTCDTCKWRSQRTPCRNPSFRLADGEGQKARAIIAEIGLGDADRYCNDVPGRLLTFTRIAGERGL